MDRCHAVLQSVSKFSGTIFNSTGAWTNPLGGREHLSATAMVIVPALFSLRNLDGKTVRFRWRLGTVTGGTGAGWMVDDVHLYFVWLFRFVPAVKAPLNNALLPNYMPTLTWQASGLWPIVTRFKWHKMRKFSQLVVNETALSSAQYTFTSPLLDNARYYWRVRARNALNQYSDWSVPGLSELHSTADPRHSGEWRSRYGCEAYISWSSSPGAVSYNVVISDYDNLRFHS